MSFVVNCSKATIPVDPDENLTKNVYLNLSRFKSGSGTLEDPYCWQDVLELIDNFGSYNALNIFTWGSDYNLVKETNQIKIHNKTFAKSIGQKIKFIGFRPCDLNPPIIGWEEQLPLVDMKLISGITFEFSGINFQNKDKIFNLDNVNYSDIILGRSHVTMDISEYNYPKANLVDIKHSQRLILNILSNSIVDLREITRSDIPMIREWDSKSTVLSSPSLDINLNFDTEIRTFDSFESDELNYFNIMSNYFSFNDAYPVLKTSNYKAIVNREFNFYRAIKGLAVA